MTRTKRTREDDMAPSVPKKSKLMVDQETFKKVLEVVGKKIELIDYLYAAIDGRMDPEVVDEIAKLREYAGFLERVKGNPWLGDTVVPTGKDTDFHNFQRYLANKAGSEIHEKNITLDCAISDNSEFIRGYTSDGQQLDDHTTDALDKLFNAWLAAQQLVGPRGETYNLISMGGYIYQAHKGEIVQDAQGNLVKVDPDKFRELVRQKEGGFEDFMQKNNKDVEQVAINLHRYPEEAAEPTSPS